VWIIWRWSLSSAHRSRMPPDPDDKSFAVVAGQGQYEDDQDEKEQPDDQPDQTRPIHSQILDPPPT